MEDVATKINRFYGIIRDYEEGGPGTRYKSWEWCHQAFLESRESFRNATDEETKNNIVEQLSLHLAFYLASWGMYRGSSYLLQRDYKAHKNAVTAILNVDYELLWNYEPTEENVNEASKLLFGATTGIYWKIKNSYKGYDEENDEVNEDESSDTLTTKILMGTFGCVPAFDRFLKSGISRYNKAHEGRKTRINGYKLTQSLEKQNGGGVTDSFKALAYFAIQNRDALRIDANFVYPAMKCVDMYFWEAGYEVDLANGLNKADNSDVKKDKLLQNAIELGICAPGLSYGDAADELLRRN